MYSLGKILEPQSIKLINFSRFFKRVNLLTGTYLVCFFYSRKSPETVTVSEESCTVISAGEIINPNGMCILICLMVSQVIKVHIQKNLND